MSELKQAMRDRITVIGPNKKPVKVRPEGFDPKADHRVWNFDRNHNVWTRIDLSGYKPSAKIDQLKKGVY